MQNPIYWFLPISLSFLFSNCDQPTSQDKIETSSTKNIEQHGIVTFTGKVHHLTEEHQEYRSVIINHLYETEQEEVYFEIDSGGNFWVQFEVERKQDILYSLGPIFEYIMVEPGDSIHIDAYADSIHFSGDHALANNQFSKLHTDQFTAVFYDRKTYEDPLQHYRHCDSVRNEKVLYVDSLSQATKLDSDFAWWLENFITTNYLSELFENLEAVSIHDSLSELSIEDILYSVTRENFINTDWQSIPALTFQYQSIGLEYGEEHFKNLLERLRTVTKEPCFMKDVIIHQRFIESMHSIPEEWFNSHKEYIETEVLDSTLKQNIYRFYDKYFNHNKSLSNIKLLDNNFTPNSILSQIAQQNPNKVIYIDVWATWCKPCIKEMELSYKYTSDLEDVVFVYLCMDGNKESWENTISRLNLDGYHHFVPTEERVETHKELNIPGYPSYFIISKDGTVLQKGWEYGLSHGRVQPLLDSLLAKG